MTKKYQGLMIDLETLGTKPDAAVVQIGATAFNYDSSKFMNTITINLIPDFRRCSVDWPTVAWWLNQSKEARDSITSLPRNPMVEGLVDLNSFFQQNCSIKGEVWAYPAVFDIPIIENLYRLCDLSTPWKRQRVMCVRTLKFLSPKAIERPEPTIKHDAGADSLAQAMWVNRMRWVN